MTTLHGPLEPSDLQMLAFLGRVEGPVLCDGAWVKRLVSRGLVERTEAGWRISPAGRMRLHMRR